MKAKPRRWQQYGLHFIRVLLFVSVLLLIRQQHLELLGSSTTGPVSLLAIEDLASVPDASSIDDQAAADGSQTFYAVSGERLGEVLQTAPLSDGIVGFSGPTNLLLVFDTEDTLASVRVLSSGDTRDHVRSIEQDSRFFSSMLGLSREELSEKKVDAVSGATLTSMAIRDSIAVRLKGNRTALSLRFPEFPTLPDVQETIPETREIVAAEGLTSAWWVVDAEGKRIASFLRTTPFADQVIGFQGPTDAWLFLDLEDNVQGIWVDESFDNEPYVSYVREDEYFLSLFNGKKLTELSKLDPFEAQIEGVSGATMTSLAVVDGLVEATGKHLHQSSVAGHAEEPWLKWSFRDYATGMILVVALLIGLTPLRGNKQARICLQVLLIGYLGLVNGDMLSQAMVVGWAKAGVPWQNAGGLVLLSLVALLVPIFSKHNLYCTHICPHGALQQVVKNRLPWKLKLGPNWSRVLKAIPVILLLWCVVVAMTGLGFSLVDIEPFDAWVFRVAGWATITVAVAGLVASLFVPMAYCRFGCPTGLLLGFLRFNSRSHRWSNQDWIATALTCVALGLWLLF